jgi:hypothetical protein
MPRRCQAQVLLPHNGSSDGNPAGVTPRVFLSYSHDSEAHRAWVRRLAERLLEGGVEVTSCQATSAFGPPATRKLVHLLAC